MIYTLLNNKWNIFIAITAIKLNSVQKFFINPREKLNVVITAALFKELL